MSNTIRIPIESLIIQERMRQRKENRPALRIETPRYIPEERPPEEPQESFIEINISGEEEEQTSNRGVVIISMI